MVALPGFQPGWEHIQHANTSTSLYTNSFGELKFPSNFHIWTISEKSDKISSINIPIFDNYGFDLKSLYILIRDGEG
jgi:hypothetical protein